MSDEFTDFVANLEPQYANSANYTFVFNSKAHGGASLGTSTRGGRGCTSRSSVGA
jgi:hypothetical protein